MSFRASAWIVLAVGILATVVLLLTGCTQVKGGQARHEQGESAVTGGQSIDVMKNYSVTVATPYGPISVQWSDDHSATTQPSSSSSHDIVATTQASVSTSQDVLPSFGAADEGDLGSLTFKAVKRIKPSWALAGVFVLLGLGFWKLAGNYLLAAGCIPLAILAVLYPELLVLMSLVGIVVVAALIFFAHRTQAELVEGVNNVLDSATDLSTRESMKTRLAAAADRTTKRVVKGVK